MEQIIKDLKEQREKLIEEYKKEENKDMAFEIHTAICCIGYSIFKLTGEDLTGNLTI